MDDAVAYRRRRADPGRLVGSVAEGITWDHWDREFDPSHRAPRSLVPRRAPEHLLQLHRSSRPGRAWRATGADLGQPDDRADRDLHLSPDADRVTALAGALAALGWRRRPRRDLSADGAGSRDRHARLRTPGRDPFRRVRRFRRGGACVAHRPTQVSATATPPNTTEWIAPNRAHTSMAIAASDTSADRSPRGRLASLSVPPAQRRDTAMDMAIGECLDLPVVRISQDRCHLLATPAPRRDDRSSGSRCSGARQGTSDRGDPPCEGSNTRSQRSHVMPSATARHQASGIRPPGAHNADGHPSPPP